MRPIYHYQPRRIRAHILICQTAESALQKGFNQLHFLRYHRYYDQYPAFVMGFNLSGISLKDHWGSGGAAADPRFSGPKFLKRSYKRQ